jgi:hypothetical protein
MTNRLRPFQGLPYFANREGRITQIQREPVNSAQVPQILALLAMHIVCQHSSGWRELRLILLRYLQLFRITGLRLRGANSFNNQDI